VDNWRDAGTIYQVTVGGAQNGFQAALEAGVQRLIHTNSVAVLGGILPHMRKGKDELRFSAIRSTSEAVQDSYDWYKQTGYLVFFDEASHWVQHDEAKRVNLLLLEFLGNSF
jgi:hypothetical protein